MKTLSSFILIAALAFACQSCLQKKTVGNGTITENVVPIADYTKIEIDGAVTLIYEQKDSEPYLKIETDENIFPLLKVEVNSDGKLEIKHDDDSNIKPTKYNVYTNSRELFGLKFAGSSKTSLKGKVKTSTLKIDIAGSGEITADSLVCDVLDIDIAGSGTINLVGTATKSTYDVSGSGTVNALDFQSNNVKCSIAGSGKMFVTALDALDIDIAGSGNIQYKGDPSIKQSIAGSGKITKLDSNQTQTVVGTSAE